MKQKVYITEYALTKGIITEMATIKKITYGADMAVIGSSKKVFKDVFFIGVNAFFDKNEAIKNAEKQKLTKIAQLKVQISKLEEIKFT